MAQLLRLSLCASAVLAALWAADAIHAPEPKFVVKMLREGGRAAAAPGSMVFAAGSPWCRYNVDVNGFPVEKQADGRWAFFGAAGAGRRLVGTHDPLELFGSTTTGGLAERRALQRAYAAARCQPEAVASLVPEDPREPRGARTGSGSGGPAAPGRGLLSTSGTRSNLVLLLRWSDHAARQLPGVDKINGLFSSSGLDAASWPSGSVRSYYAAQSYGKLQIASVVADWVTVPQSEAQAARGTSGMGLDASGGSTLHQAILFALDQLNATGAVNFAQLDQDGDGVLDSLTVVHSGYAAEWGGVDAYGAAAADRIWSHKWTLVASRTYSGVYVRNYNMNPGVWGTSGSAIGRIGVMCHELGHSLGLPDLYDGAAPVHATFGALGVMSSSWGADGSQFYPGSFSPWSKEQLGWANVVTAQASGTLLLRPFQSSGDVIKITSGFPSTEYLLIEARSNSSAVSRWDSQLPAGIYVWHIDTNSTANVWNNAGGSPGDLEWPAKHDRVRLIQADNKWDLEKQQWWAFDAGDAYTSAAQLLSDRSEPALLSYEQMLKPEAARLTTGNTLSGFVFSNTGTSSLLYTRTAPEALSKPASAPSPASTKAPVAAQPTTAPPVTPAPVTPAPVTPAPATPAPTTTKPTTSKPTTSKPTAQPMTVQPTTVQPTTAQPTTAQPTMMQLPTAQPTMMQPTTAKPTTAQPATARPTTARPTTAQPATLAPSSIGTEICYAASRLVAQQGYVGFGQVVGNLEVRDQSGTGGRWSRYVEFLPLGRAPKFVLGVTPSTLTPLRRTRVRAEVNFRGPARAEQPWQLAVVDASGVLVPLLDNAPAPSWSWTLLQGAAVAQLDLSKGLVQFVWYASTAADASDLDYARFCLTPAP